MSTNVTITNMGSSLIPIKGISRSLHKILEMLQIYDVATLLIRCNTPEKRQQVRDKIIEKQKYVANKDKKKLSNDQLITLQQVNMWLRQADLWRIEGINADEAWLIAQAGVRNVQDLALCDCNTLLDIVMSLSTSQLDSFSYPTEEKLKEYIQKAKLLRPQQYKVSNLANLRTKMGIAEMNDALITALHAIGIYRICQNENERENSDCLTSLTPSDRYSILRVYKSEGYGITEKTEPPSENVIKKLVEAAKEYGRKFPNDRIYRVYTPAASFELDMSDQPTPHHLFAVTDDEIKSMEVVGTFETITKGLKAINMPDTIGLPNIIRGRVTLSNNNERYTKNGILVQLSGFLCSVNDLDQIDKPVQAFTDRNGKFEIHMPEKYNFGSILTFTFSNEGGEQRIQRPVNDILTHRIESQSATGGPIIICDLCRDMTFFLEYDKFSAASSVPKALPSVRLQGEENENAVYLDPDTAPARVFNYSLLQRLTVPGSTKPRMTVNAPIEVHKFRQNVKSNQNEVCMSSGLSIGYVLNMEQAWVPDGYALGDLLYSLVLSPGEEQRIVVRDRSEQYTIADNMSGTDSLTDNASMSQNDMVDELFHQTAAQSGWASQYANYSTKTKSKSTTGTLIIASGNSSAASSSGHSSANAASHNLYSNASQAASRFQTAIASNSARLAQTNRVAIRTASSNESESASTKIIANHNHSHIMTVQYWEVMRRYKLKTCISDVKLVLFVPLNLIPFYTNEKESTDYTEYKKNITSEAFKKRYGGLMLYNDILRECLPYHYRRGLDLCEEIYNTKDWKKCGESADLPITVTITGNFIAEDEMNVFLRTKDGAIIHPTSSTIPKVATEKDHSEEDVEAVIEYYKGDILTKSALKKLVADNRRKSSGKKFIYSFNIPASRSYDTSFILEINRSCKAVAVSRKELKPDEDPGLLAEIQNQKKPYIATLDGDEVLNAAPLRVEVGVASHLTNQESGNNNKVSGETFSVRMVKQELDRRTLIPISRTGSIYYSESELRQVENLYQHVLNNTYEYSRSVWEGLSDGERVLMLEGYTIDMDINRDNIKTTTQYPLLNCVDAMTPLGIYGNSLILPFYIPDDKDVVDSMSKESGIEGLSNALLQERIYKHYTNNFRVPTAEVSIPTHGMIGEAVLGETNVSELIDLTRFWNWKDSDIEHTQIDASYLNDTSLLKDLNAPTVQMPTQGASLPQHVQATQLLKELTKEPKFVEILSNLDMRELLKQADKNTSTGRDHALTKSSETTQKAIDAASKIATSFITKKNLEEADDNKSNGKSDGNAKPDGKEKAESAKPANNQKS